MYPTLARIALDVLPIQASSIPCERLFSDGGWAAVRDRSRLGSERFEQLQMMKNAWRNNVVDLAAWNANMFEEILADDEGIVYYGKDLHNCDMENEDLDEARQND